LWGVFPEKMLGHLLVVVLGFALIVGLGLRIIGRLLKPQKSRGTSDPA
jgi:hypothetical protein